MTICESRTWIEKVDAWLKPYVVNQVGKGAVEEPRVAAAKRLNEDPTGLPYPEKSEHTERLSQCTAIETKLNLTTHLMLCVPARALREHLASVAVA